MPSAHVRDAQVLADFRAALQTFAHHAARALEGAATEVQRVQVWLQEQLQVWTVEVRQAEDAVFAAKSELAMRRFMKAGDRPVDTTEQEKVLKRALARLDHAEAKKASTKRWLRELPEAVREYEGQARPFLDLLEHDLPRMAGWLDQKVVSLEAYAQTPPPTEGGPA